MATCYNHVIHARNRPWGKAQGRVGPGRVWLPTWPWPHVYHMAVLGASIIRSKNQRKQESSPVTRDWAPAPCTGPVHATHWISSESSCTDHVLVLPSLGPESPRAAFGRERKPVPFFGYTHALPSSRSQSKKGI